MTTIKNVMREAEIIRNLGTKKVKTAYISNLHPDIQQFLSASINMNGIGPEIAQKIKTNTSKISSFKIGTDKIGITSTTLEGLIDTFDVASKIGSSNEKRAVISEITLAHDEKDFVMQALYSVGGNLNLGITIPRISNGINDIISPMLASNKEFDPSQYQIEPKLDGYRLLAKKINGEVILQSRNGKPLVIERITRELERYLPEGSLVDGEVLALDGDFQSLKRHGEDIQYTVFDALYVDGLNIMNKPLTQRRSKLEGLDLSGRINIPEILDLTTITDVDDWIRTTGAEGIIAKSPNSIYKPKNRGWIKRKLMNDLNAKIVGMTAGTGKRKGMMGAIVVEPEGLAPVQTKIGTGFSDIELVDITDRINRGEQLNCVVRYQDITRDNRLRFPVFVRLI